MYICFLVTQGVQPASRETPQNCPFLLDPQLLCCPKPEMSKHVLRFDTAQVAMKLTWVTSSLKALVAEEQLYIQIVSIRPITEFRLDLSQNSCHIKNAQPTSPYPLPRHSIHHSRLDLEVSSREKLSQIHPKIPKVDSWRMLVFTSWFYPPTKDASGK